VTRPNLSHWLDLIKRWPTLEILVIGQIANSLLCTDHRDQGIQKIHLFYDVKSSMLYSRRVGNRSGEIAPIGL
jgi:hypothetical protein